MDTISNLRNEIDTTANAIIAVMKEKKYNCDDDIKRWKKLNKTWETLEPKIQEETLVLGTMRHISSPTLVRYNAKLQVLVDEYKKFLVMITPSPTPVVRLIDLHRESFRRFVKERVRQLRYGYEETVNEKVSLKELLKAYNRWSISSEGGKKIDALEFEHLCHNEFGHTNKREWSHIRVFLDEDELEEFEKEHEESMTKSTA